MVVPEYDIKAMIHHPVKGYVEIVPLIGFFIHPLVKDTREWLQKKCHADVTSPESNNYRYRGLCDTACDRFVSEATRLASEYGIRLEAVKVHGEQKHSPRIHSSQWMREHTWLIVTYVDMYDNSYKLYVDPTSEQFQDLYDDIPDYYISDKPLRWYYPDKRNPAFHGWTNKLNKRLYIRKHVREDPSWETIIHYGIIEFWQYEIWGRISNFIYHHKKK